MELKDCISYTYFVAHLDKNLEGHVHAGHTRIEGRNGVAQISIVSK
jgi:hypothetical protein